MRFSIAIPAYKATYLSECIKSVLSQTFDDFEIIILNDCSPENIKGIINEFSSHSNYNKIRYYENENNVGVIDVVDNWNKLLSLSYGEFIICMGDDDMLDVDCLKEYNSLINKHPDLDVYHARTMMIDESSKFCDLQEERPEWQSVYSLIWHHTFKEGVQFIGDFLFRTTSLRKNGGFFKLPMAWGSDCVTSFIAASSNGVANISKPIFYYRRNSNSITNSSDIRVKMVSTKMYFDWMMNFLKKKPEDEMDVRYWNLIKTGFTNRIHHHEIYMIGADIQKNILSSLWYWLKKRKNYGLSLSQLLFAFGIGLAMKIR